MSINRERLYAPDQSTLAVGVEVYIDTSQGRHYGLIVEMGDTDTRPGCVLVYEGPDHDYPGWWSADIVTPSRMGRGRVTDRRLDQRLAATPTASPTAGGLDVALRRKVREVADRFNDGEVSSEDAATLLVQALVDSDNHLAAAFAAVRALQSEATATGEGAGEG